MSNESSNEIKNIHWSKLYQYTCTYTLEKSFVKVNTSEGFWVLFFFFFFQTELKHLYYTLVCMSLLCISREEETK